MTAAKATASDWTDALDFKRALKNCHKDFLGDWYRDPWGWVELDWAVDEAIDDLVRPHVNSAGVGHVSRMDVAKENFGIRPAVVMDPLDRLCFQALVDTLSKRLSKALPPWVCGWRLPRKNAKVGLYERQDSEWETFRHQLRSLAGFSQAALRTDIVSFFASVPVDRLAQDVVAAAGGRVADRLVDMLHGFDAVHGRAGLPQRSAASALLANSYLGPLDEYLASRAEVRGWLKMVAPFGRVLRWMDDVWVLGSKAGELRSIQVEVYEVLLSLGLNMNNAKTDVFEGEQVQQEALRLDHSAVDSALSETPLNAVPLEELVERVLDAPEQADRTTVRFATTRMREQKLFGQVDGFVEKAHRMPHTADALARLFRDSDAWSSLEDWYVAFTKSDWAAIDWTVAQLGTMFPTATSGSDALKELFATGIKESSLAKVGLSAQRLASWDKDLARDSIRVAAASADNPQVRRVLALSALAAGERRTLVRSLLGEFKENQITLRMLEATNFKRPAVKADFQGA